MTTIRAGQWTYAVTPDDRLWLLRAVHAEGPPHDRVAKALVNLYAQSWADGSGRSTLASLVQAYATPLMPDRVDSPPGSPLREKRLAHRARTEFSEAAHAAVRAAMADGASDDVTDYAAWHVDAAPKGYVPRSASVPGTNRLWTRAPGWPGYTTEEAMTPDLLRRAIRAVAMHLPTRDKQETLDALAALTRVGAALPSWAQESADTLRAMWETVAQGATKVGVYVRGVLTQAGIAAADAARLVADAGIETGGRMVDTMTRPLRDTVSSLAWPITVVGVLALMMSLRKR